MLKKIIDNASSPFATLAHVSIVVQDIEKAIDYYETIGIGPFIPPANHEFSTKSYRGKKLKSTLIIKEAQIGPIVLQLVQPIEGDCVAKEFLERKGEGVYHLGFRVDDVQAEEKKLVQSGVKVLQRGRRDDNSGYAYFDTEKYAGVILEIKQVPDQK